jgi:hypothetical protein
MPKERVMVGKARVREEVSAARADIVPLHGQLILHAPHSLAAAAQSLRKALQLDIPEVCIYCNIWPLHC